MTLVIDENANEIAQSEITPQADDDGFAPDKFYVIQVRIKGIRGKHIYMKLPYQPMIDITAYATDLFIDKNVNGGLPNMELRIKAQGIYLRVMGDPHESVTNDS